MGEDSLEFEVEGGAEISGFKWFRNIRFEKMEFHSGSDSNTL